MDDVKLCGMFEDLQIEELGENPLGDAPPVVIIDADAQTASIRFKLEQQEGEAAFKILCLLRDLDDVRSHGRQIWRDFKDGQISFMAAGLLTNTAFGLMRRADENFAAITLVKSTARRLILESLGLTTSTYKRGVWLWPDPERPVSSPRVPESDIDIVE